LGPDTLYTCAAQVIAGRVSTADAKPLTITAPANLRRPMDPQKCSAKDAGLVVSHSCDGFVLSAERSDELDVDAPFGAGVTVVDWTITGPFDALATTHQSIEVFDDQAPTISAPADL